MKPDVCPHCGRHPQVNNWAMLVAVVCVTVMAAVLGSRFGPEHWKYAALETRRAAWHQRCDTVREAGKATDPAAYDACNRELDGLIAEAARNAWVR